MQNDFNWFCYLKQCRISGHRDNFEMFTKKCRKVKKNKCSVVKIKKLYFLWFQCFFWTHLEFFSSKEMCLCDVSFLRYKAKKLVNFWKWTTFGGFKKYLNHICRYLLWFLWFTSSILKMLLNLFWNWSIFGLIIGNILFDVFFNKIAPPKWELLNAECFQLILLKFVKISVLFVCVSLL